MGRFRIQNLSCKGINNNPSLCKTLKILTNFASDKLIISYFQTSVYMELSIFWLKLLSSYYKFWFCLLPASDFLEEKEDQILSYYIS